MDKPLTLLEHLSELRKRIIISLLAIGIATIVSFSFSSQLLKVLKLPASGLIEKLVFFSPEGAFLIYLRIALFSGIIISMPVILYQLWAFVNPAIEERFKRGITYFILFSSILFIAGCAFCYFMVLPPALRFLLGFAQEELAPVISAERYISFVTILILGMGLIFQMPVVSFFLARWGIINARLLRRKYKYAIVVIFIIAAMITPTADVFNMLVFALPMLILYEISIWIAYVVKRLNG